MTCHLTLICAAAPARPVFPADDPAAPAALARAGRVAPGRARCLVSPLLRARQTAAALGLAATPDPALREADFGAWAGQAVEAVLAADPAGFALWRTDPAAAPPGGESFAAMAARVTTWLEAQAAAGGRVLAITHPGPIQAALLAVLGAPPTAAARIGVRPLSRTRLSHDGARWSLLIEG